MTCGLTALKRLIAYLRQQYICATYTGECEHCRDRRRRKEVPR